MDPPIIWEALCGNSSPFWDFQLSWNSTEPELTKCFRNTVLVWVPCLILWIFLPIEIYCLIHSKSGYIRWNLLNITKQISCTILLILFVVKLSLTVYYHIHGVDVSLDEFLSPALLITCFLLTNILIYYERKQGMQSSALLFFFWLFLTLSESLTFRSILLQAWRKMLAVDRIDYCIFMIQYPLVVSQFILSVVKDGEPLYRNPDDIEENACPMNTSSFISKLTFSWFDRLLWLGYRHTLELTDVWKSSPEVLTKNTVPQFLRYWKTSKKNTLQRVIWKCYWPTFIKAWSIRILGDALIYASPFLLQQFLIFVSDDEPFWHGFVYIFAMFIAALSESVCCWHGAFYGLIVKMGVSSSFISMIYRKSLTLCNSAKQATTTGEIINHMAIDVDHVAEFMYNFVFDMTFPIQICIGLYMLYNLLGVAAFGGLIAMVVMILVSGFIAHQIEKVEVKYLKYKDQRIKQINEAILGIKVLKLFAWEKPFIERITSIRQKEAYSKRKGLILQGATTLMWRVSTLTVSLVCFTTYIMLDPKHVIDAPTAFVTLMLVDILSIPMMRLPSLIAYFVQAYVSMRRLNKFMACKDLDSDIITRHENDDSAITVKNANFSWDLNEVPQLCDVSFKVPRGSLLAVVGPVGCGKSSLVSALLGEMEKVKGTVNIKGKVAYVPQQAWIQNATFKENILLGKPFQERLYKSVIKACALEPDLAILAGGDETEIGEKGINLSGGQKQRVSLARAVYNDADVYLLDDPLSAVDSHVGEHIFEHVIGPTGLLKNKTRVLVTHGISHLPKVDEIVVICKGCITESGTYKQLVDQKGAFSELLATYGRAGSEDKKTYTRTESVVSNTKTINDDLEDAGERSRGIKLTTTEHVEEGEVNKSVYALYLKYVGPWASVAIFGLMSISMALSTSANIWLSIWSADPVSPDPEKKTALQNMRLGVYAVLESSFAAVMFLGILTLVFASMKAAIALHSKMLMSIFRSPMSFFDTTPSGRIVNRFSKDVDMVDNVLPNSFQDFLIGFLEIVSAAIVICIKLPWLILIFVPVTGLYYVMQKFFVKTADQLRRLESITRSPIFSRFSETIAGASTVRAFQLENKFIQQFDEMLDTSLKNKFHSNILFRWIGLRLDLLGNVLVVFTALFAMYQRGIMDGSTIALIVTYAHAINFTFCWLVYNAGLLESNIVSVERLHEYISLKPEASWDQTGHTPPSLWPAKGNVQFQNYSTKYREGLPPVLHGLTCEINDGEKIGVVGRTGAGKSSITLSLFRIIEATEGAIVIDGVDISKIGLHDLRNRLTIIPQDPVLYSGSLRMNLDPFDQHSDIELWKALEHAHLKAYVSSLAAELQHEIAEGGENLSVGQRQLVCLARALLRKTKILILDEATAAVDLETDDLIQATIREEFADSTVITIAHRINTILDYSRVIVMDNGSIQEFDKPDTLLNDKKSVFHSMAKFAGLVE